VSVCAGITEDDMLVIVKEKVNGSRQCEAAKRLRVSTSLLSDVLNGRKGVSDQLAQKFGYERRVVFVKKKA
jgi:hypothetical protein